MGEIITKNLNKIDDCWDCKDKNLWRVYLFLMLALYGWWHISEEDDTSRLLLADIILNALLFLYFILKIIRKDDYECGIWFLILFFAGLTAWASITLHQSSHG